MNKLITFAIALSVTIPVFSQKADTHTHSPGKAFQKKESSGDLLNNKYSKYLPLRQKASDLTRHKNTNAVKQQLDVVYWADQEKDEYRYDNMGNVIEDIYYEWDNNQWLRVMKSEYSYDDMGNNIMHTESEWVGGQWQNSMKYEAAFDSDGNNTLNLSYIWVDTEWINIYGKEEYSYDASGNQTEHISSYWVETEYMYSGKEVFSYDDNGNQVQNISYLWDGAQWINSYQSKLTYNSNKDLTLIITSSWDGNAWVDNEKFQISYHPSGKISQSVYSFMEGDQWMEVQTFNYEYDLNGNMTLFDMRMEDITMFKEISVYDEYGNRVENSIYEGDWETGLLVNSWKAETSYDNSVAFEDLILPFIPEDYENDDDDDYSGYENEGLSLNLLFNHKLLRIVNYEGDGDNWVLESDYTLVYSEQNITGLGKENSGSGLRIHPNPASGQVSFTLDAAVDRFQLEIFDAQGKMLISQIAENNMPVSIGILEGGVYFYRLEAPGIKLNGKLLVQ